MSTTTPVARSSGPASPSTTSATPKPLTTASGGPTINVTSTAVADRVMRTDKRGRKVLDAHRLPARYADMNAKLNANVLGQSHAFPPILGCIQRYESGLGDPNRPVGAGFLGGPTGVGKTLTAEQIAIMLHGRPLFIKINCTELMEKAQLTSFIGASPMYVGHGKTMPLLTQEFIDSHKSENSDIVVLLLDEFEKAHPDFQKLLLNVEENGVLKVWMPKKAAKGAKPGDNDGAEHVEVKMYNVLILKTTNAGVERFAKRGNDGPSIGFAANVDGRKAVGPRAIPTPDEFRDELRGNFAPEFLNRQDFFVFYNWLQPEHMPLIRRREIAKVEALLSSNPKMRGAALRMTAAANEWVEKRGFDADYGARPLRRLVQNAFVTPLGNLVSEGIITPFDAIAAQVSEDGERLDFVPLRLTTGRAKEKLATAAAQDAMAKDDAPARVARLESALEAVMSALPTTSGLHHTLEAAAKRASDTSDPNARANILRESIDLAIRGHRPLQQTESPAVEAVKGVIKESKSRALTIIPSSNGPGVAPAQGNQYAAALRPKEGVKAARDNADFREQMTDLLTRLSSFLPLADKHRLTKTILDLGDKGMATARMQVAEVLEDVALKAFPSRSKGIQVHEATAGALRAVVHLLADASLDSTGNASKAIQEGRAIALAALEDAVKLSGAQEIGAPESDLRGTVPFAIFRKQNELEAMRDTVIERLVAMREVAGDAVYKGEPIPADKQIPAPASIVQAIGIAYAAQKIENPVLRETVQSTIDGYLDKRPLEATPRQLQDLEQLIRTCAPLQREEIEALCENFSRAQLTSGSLFRGGKPQPPVQARRGKPLGLPPKRPK